MQEKLDHCCIGGVILCAAVASSIVCGVPGGECENLEESTCCDGEHSGVWCCNRECDILIQTDDAYITIDSEADSGWEPFLIQVDSSKNPKCKFIPPDGCVPPPTCCHYNLAVLTTHNCVPFEEPEIPENCP